MISRSHRLTRPLPTLLSLALGLGTAFAAAAPARAGVGDDPAGTATGYSYVRTLEGAATLIQTGDGTREQAELNQPLLPGDRLWVSPRSRAEVLLSDGNVLRIDSDSEVEFRRLAGSPDSGDRTTVFGLNQGNLQLIVAEDSQGDDWPSVETANVTVAVREAGRYRVTALEDWTELVVREGSAEVSTDRETVGVEAGEELRADGVRAPQTALLGAGREDGLERWGERLETRVAEVPYVDRSLAYAAAPMADHGSWVSVESRWAWRPRVGTDWRPYWHGRWSYNSGGLVWISDEPWGWVPYHYGSWDLVPGYGWVWFPGRRFSPAWVYWYWGPREVAWVPVGYYTRYYHRHYRYPGFRFGVYGWAGGDWDAFADWTFCSVGSFGRRDQRRHHWDGRSGYHRTHEREVARGLITTDTRALPRGSWRDADEVTRVLRTRPGAGDLADVTPFVSRRGELSGDLRRRVVVDSGDTGKLAGTPLAPEVAEVAPPQPRPRPRPWVERGETKEPGKEKGEPAATVLPRPRPRPYTPASDETGKGSEGRPMIRPRPRPAAPAGDAPAAGQPAEDGKGGETVRPRPRPRPENDPPAGEPAKDSGGEPMVRPRPRPAPPAEDPPAAHKPSGDSGSRGYETARPRPRPSPPPAESKPEGDSGQGATVRVRETPARERPSGSGSLEPRRAAPERPAARPAPRREAPAQEAPKVEANKPEGSGDSAKAGGSGGGGENRRRAAASRKRPPG